MSQLTRKEIIDMSFSMRTEIAKRHDSKFNLWAFTVDPTYDPSQVDETNVSFIPQRWIILDVYDSFSEAENAQQIYVKKKKKARNNHEKKSEKT